MGNQRSPSALGAGSSQGSGISAEESTINLTDLAADGEAETRDERLAAPRAKVIPAGSSRLSTDGQLNRAVMEAVAESPQQSDSGVDLEVDTHLANSRRQAAPDAMTASTVQWLNRQAQGPSIRSEATAATAAAGIDANTANASSQSSTSLAAVLNAAARQQAAPASVQNGAAVFQLPPQAKRVGQPQWQTAIAERVAVMASQRISAAEIQLDPPELGQLQVRVTLNQEQASVSFVSQHSVVREALDQTAFRLREMFDAEGLDLVDVDISDQGFQERQSSGEGGGHSQGAEDDELEPVTTHVRLSQGLVDHFV
jgi:flagellar hook-length control protein FliK